MKASELPLAELSMDDAANQAASKKTPFTSQTNNFIEDAMNALNVPGLALAVIDAEDIFVEGFGYADLKKTIKVDEKTSFAVGSTTKAFTAAAVSLLVDDKDKYKDITWTTPIHKLIPEDFVLDTEWNTQHITIEDALSHRTGLAGHMALLGRSGVKENTRNLRNLAQGSEPRTKWEYTNHMYWAISHMIEVQIGQSLGEFMKERIWGPLSMENTYMGMKAARAAATEKEGTIIAEGQQWNEEIQALEQAGDFDDEGISGAGGIVSTISDYAKWIKALVQRSSPFSAAGHAALTHPRAIISPGTPESNFSGAILYALGWQISVYHGERVAFHPGGLPGFKSTAVFFLDRKFGVAAMTNCTSSGAPDVFVWRLIADAFGVPENERIDLVAKTKAELGMYKGYWESAKDRIFPDIPSIPKSFSLAVRNYAGTYVHPGYGTLLVSIKEGKLTAYIDGKIPFDIDLEHVTGESFLASALIMKSQIMKAKVEFDVQGGEVKRLGFHFEESRPDLAVWYVKEP